jgi:hypothetical protein
MRSIALRSRHSLAAGVAATLVLAACRPDAPTAVVDGTADLALRAGVGKVNVCHRPGPDAEILDVGAPALAAHLAHGDYVTTLLVTRDAVPPGDEVRFATIGGALAAAREGRLARGELVTAACRITISVAAGTYPGSTAAGGPGQERFPLVVDVPAITLRGAFVMTLDANGRATGEGEGDVASVLAPTAPLPVTAGASTPLIIANAHPGGSAGHGLVVEGFVLRSGQTSPTAAGGQGVLSVRADSVLIRGNRFEGGFTESVDVRGGSAEVRENHLAGTNGTCDVCLAGPGTFRAIGNRLLAGGIPGITVSGVLALPVPAGVEPIERPATAEIWAEVRNNEVRDHRRTPVGVGIRVETVGNSAPNVRNTIHAEIRDNLLLNNRFGLIVHAGFPVAGTLLQSDADVVLGGNAIEQSCQAKLLVSLSRHQTTLGLNSFPWLRNSTYRLAVGGDVDWSNPKEAWYGHPAGFGNTLVVDGQEIANGTRQSYSATTCPAS